LEDVVGILIPAYIRVIGFAEIRRGVILYGPVIQISLVYFYENACITISLSIELSINVSAV
jgi:hypothetical protein